MEYSSFFNSVAGDRKYKAEEMAAHFAQLLTSGVFPVGTQLQITPAGGMTVSLSAGSAWINGYSYRNGDALTKVLATSDAVLHRIDRVVIRWDRAERKIAAVVLMGVPASSPAAPAIVRDVDYYDLGIALISVAAGTVLITQEMITDTRGDTSACGFVSSLIRPDTSGWFAQFDAAFWAWFADVQDVLDGDTAGNLLNLINAHKADTANPHGVTAAQIGAAVPGLLVTGLTLPTSGYSGTGPYTIDITATGASTAASKVYNIIPVLSDVDATREAEQTAWDLILDRKVPSANKVRIKVSSVPVTAVSFILKEVV